LNKIHNPKSRNCEKKKKKLTVLRLNSARKAKEKAVRSSRDAITKAHLAEAMDVVSSRSNDENTEISLKDEID